MAERILLYLTLVIILFIVYMFILMYTMFYSKRVPKDTVLAFTGGLGQGKSLIGVNTAIKRLNRNRLLYCLGFLNQEELPLLYSNIPITFKNSLVVRIFYKLRKNIKLPKFQFSVILKYEHLTCVERLNEYSVCFIDELGQFADQYSHDNPLVMQFLTFFVRFFRHFLDGNFIYTDQSSDNVVKPIRTRTNLIHNLSGFKRKLIFFYKVDVTEMLLTEDVSTIDSNQLEDKPYFFGHLPFKIFKKLDITRIFSYKKYDSRCYKPLYDYVKFSLEELDLHEKYTTSYLIELPNQKELKTIFKNQGYITRTQMMKYVNLWKDKDKQELSKDTK